MRPPPAVVCPIAIQFVVLKIVVPKTIDTGFFWYDKSNINDPQIQAVLYK